MGSLQGDELVHNWFMDLANPSKAIVYYLPIDEMTYLGCRHEFPIDLRFSSRYILDPWLGS